jgi:tetratricopeptide (TPR) repeat protein/tRNA A-37 threonylcarbamoyl transferase component Bud32
MNEDFHHPSRLPERVSRFNILEVLGEGAMGVVYRARDTLLRRDVALKLIKPALAEEPRNRSRFLRECQAAATINHPGVATIYEAGETEDGRLFLASELVEGETLKDKVGRGPLPPAEVVEIGVQLADALAAAHTEGAIHRDIKPSNLMLTPEGRLKVLDFGLARLVAPDDSDYGDDAPTLDQTVEGAVVGTPAYMSPEQASGMKVDARTDIFSAGCVIYELVTGRSPFHSGSVPETLRRVLCEEPPSIESSVDGIPMGLEEVLRGAMAKERDKRTATAGEMAEGLRELREVPSTVGSGMMPRAFVNRRRKVALGGVAGFIVVVVAVVLAWQWSRPTLAFASRDRLLVADVENLTGEEAFDLALHTALEADLKQSPYAKLFQRHQVEQTLRLMRQSPDSVVDEKLGRDICRFSGIRALILPRILQVGDAYELQAAIVDPQTGRRVEQIRVTAEGREEVLLDAIDELAHEVRSRLGESLESIDRADFPISDVTTSSWEAMHYFALGSESWGRGDYKEAVRFYELAVDLDPQFATCRGSLGLLLIQRNIDPVRGREELSQAMADGEALPRDEYLMLRAANRHFVDQDLEGALGEYELINGIYPNNMAAYNNRGRILMALGRFDEAVVMFEKAAELDHQNSFPLVNLAFLHILYAPDASAAEEAARRLVTLDSDVANYHAFLGWSLAVQLRFDEAIEELERTLELEPNHRYALPNTGYTLLAAGNPGSAVLYLRRNLAMVREGESRPGERGAIIDLVVAMSAAGDGDQVQGIVNEAQTRLYEQKDGEAWVLDDHAYLAQIFAVAGRTDEAEEQFEIARSFEVDNADSRFELARCCAVLGRRECAIENTRLAFEMGYADPFLPMLIPSMNSLLGDPEFMKLFPMNGSELEP